MLELLKFLSLRGTIVTTDALNRRRDIARQIVENGGDSALAFKGNRRALRADISLLPEHPRWDCSEKHSTADGDHGRIETHQPGLHRGGGDPETSSMAGSGGQ